MNMQSFQPPEPLSPNESEIHTLYRNLLESWNNHNAHAYAALFAEDGNVVGFDGSQMNGRTEIASTLEQIFADHVTAPYVGKVREVRFLRPDIAMLRAVVGMIRLGQSSLNPAANAIQTLVATRHDEKWSIALFQNTPAQFHDRPELVEQFTEELSELLK